MKMGRLPEEFRDRTKRYAAGVIRLFVKVPKTQEEVRVLGRQLLRSGTSVAAHVREASRARSEDEFVSKLGGALQEADESALWLEILGESGLAAAGSTTPLLDEADQLTRIFVASINTARKGKRSEKSRNRTIEN